jgi:hypothetical protein
VLIGSPTAVRAVTGLQVVVQAGRFGTSRRPSLDALNTAQQFLELSIKLPISNCISLILSLGVRGPISPKHLKIVAHSRQFLHVSPQHHDEADTELIPWYRPLRRTACGAWWHWASRASTATASDWATLTIIAKSLFMVGQT